MRNLYILTVVAISIVGLTYVYNKDNIVTSQSGNMIKEIGKDSSYNKVKIRLDEISNLVHDLRQYQNFDAMQADQQQIEQARVTTILQDLEKRINVIEAIDIGQNQDIYENNMTEVVSSSDEDIGNDLNASNQSLSDGDLGHWVDETLSMGYLDANITISSMEQAAAGIGNNPNVNLEEIQCGEQVCRATFGQVNGAQSAINEIMGIPPFVNEGMTIEKDDGRVLVYFTQPGTTIAHLREKAGEHETLEQ